MDYLSSLLTRATLEARLLGPAKTTLIACLALYGATLLQGRITALRRKRLPLPPGPRGLPLLGSAGDIPEEEFWQKYKEWSVEYGSDVIHLSVLGTDIIVLNSLEACRELLEKRSAIYSSRPMLPMLNELVGFDWHFVFMPYNEQWKERRKLFVNAFHPTRIEQYRPRLVKAVRQFLINLLDSPDDFRAHERLLAGSFILDMGYGIKVESKDDIYIQQAERGMTAMAIAGTTSSYLVDSFPSLRFVPSWFPGAKFKRDAKIWKRDVEEMPRGSFQYAEDSIKSGNPVACLATEMLGNLDVDSAEYAENRKAVYDTLGSLYAAGSDTVVSSFSTFFLAMIQNPEIQKKAQKIIDDAISEHGRLPDFEEYKTLPYIEALVREVLRWRPVTPIAVPHMVTEDDVYKGFHIPAGARITSAK